MSEESQALPEKRVTWREQLDAEVRLYQQNRWDVETAKIARLKSLRLARDAEKSERSASRSTETRQQDKEAAINTPTDEPPASAARSALPLLEFKEEAVMRFVCQHCYRSAFKLTTDSAGRTIITCLGCRFPLPVHAPTIVNLQHRSGREHGRRGYMQLAVA